jgi:hypothetical protein
MAPTVPSRSAMKVYCAGEAIGEIVDLGVGTIVASGITPGGLVRLGVLRDRTTARRAVEMHHGISE